ncbi:VWA domain-containing protein [Antribacter gilvus]|uniref:VWA domain-containing protein n=1 Tax=Antribacter gilvus TaxID=2304675 RepID=UPI000F7691E1|nr:vWA domain-containing protein [Antribacter gilvus]
MTFQPIAPWYVLVVVAALLALSGWCLARGAASGGASRLPWLRRTALCLVLLVAGLGPSVVETSRDTTVTAVDVFFVVDRTGSMAAEDYGPEGNQERLVGVRNDVVALTTAVPGARYSVIAFDSQATRQLPLTTDARAINAWAQTFRREITLYSQGSLTDRPLDELSSALVGSAEQHPASLRLVFFLSDGEQTAEGEPRSFADLAPLIDGGAVLGYGTEEGGRMKEYDPDVPPEEAEYLTDSTETTADGVVPDALSRIDEGVLRGLADQLGVPYERRTAPTPVEHLVAGFDPEQMADDGRRTVTSYRPVVWPLGLVLAGLLAWETFAFAGSLALERRRLAGVRR